MITPSIFYKHMKNWVAKEGSFLPIKAAQFIYFDGKQAMATNNHMLAVVKDWPSDPHAETPDGIRANMEGAFPKYENLLIPKGREGWRLDLDNPFIIDNLLKDWKQVFSFARTLLKRPKELTYPLTFQMQDGRLCALTATETLAVKFVLLEGQKSEDWEQSFNAVKLLQAVEFCLETAPKELSIYNSRQQNYRAIHIETNEILLMLAEVNINANEDDSDSRAAKHARFLREEKWQLPSPPSAESQNQEEDFLS